MAFFEVPKQSRDAFRDALDRQAAEFLALLRNQYETLSSFRVACAWGPSLSSGQLHISRLLEFTQLCGLSRPPKREALRVTDSLEHLVGPVTLAEAGTDTLQLATSHMQEQLRMTVQEQQCEHMAPWRETEAPQLGFYNPELSTDQPHAKRSFDSVVAVNNLIAGLSSPCADSNDMRASDSMLLLRRDFIEGAFGFASRGRDTVEFAEYVVLLFAIAAKRYAINFKDDPHAAVRRLHRDYFRDTIRSLCPEELRQITLRSPIRRYPGVADVLFAFADPLLSVFRLLGGGLTTTMISVADFHDLMRRVGVLGIPHMSDLAVDMILSASFNFCKASEIPTNLTFERFLDAVCFMSFYVFAFEPHKTLLPTIASRIYSFLLMWGDFFTEHMNQPIESRLAVVPQGPPEVKDFSERSVDASTSHVVTVYGRNFGHHGVFFRFGSLITAAPVCSDVSALVDVPPLSPSTLDVRLIAEDSKLAIQLVRFTSVDVSVSRDGHFFSEPCPIQFVFHITGAEISLAQLQPKLWRIFVNYCKQHEQVAPMQMQIDQWKLLLEEFGIIRRRDTLATSLVEAMTLAAAEEDKDEDHRWAVDEIFAQYATPVAVDRGECNGERRARGLGFEPFVRAFIHATTVLRGDDVLMNLRAFMSNDKWLGRELLHDIPRAHKGEMSLRIRRAAQSFHLHRVLENASHNNSPRQGVWSVQALRAELRGLPKGQWSNEHDQDQLLLDFVTRQNEIEDMAIIDMRHAMEVFVNGPAINHSEDPPPLKHQLLDVDESIHIPVSSLRVDTDTADGCGTLTTITPNNRTPSADSPTAARQSPHSRSAASRLFANRQTKIMSAEEERAHYVKKEIQNLVVHSMRDKAARVARHANDADARRKRQLQRVTKQLEEEHGRRLELEKRLAELSRDHVPAEDLTFSSHTHVLRAEKVELQKEFIRQIERKKNTLEKDLVHEENMRDLERDRVVSDMREHMHTVDLMYKRLQDTVRGQSEVIRREAETIGLLKTRVNLLIEDSRFFRDAHEQLLAAVDRGKHKDVLDTLDAAKQEHESIMVEITQQLMNEAKLEGRRFKSLKEGFKRPSGGAKSFIRDDQDPASLVVLQPMESLEPPLMSLTYTEEEVEAERRKAADEVTKKYTADLVKLEESLSEANDRYRAALEDSAAQLRAAEEARRVDVASFKAVIESQQEETLELAAQLNALTLEMEKYKSRYASGKRSVPSKQNPPLSPPENRENSVAVAAAKPLGQSGLTLLMESEDIDSLMASTTHLPHTPLTGASASIADIGEIATENSACLPTEKDPAAPTAATSLVQHVDRAAAKPKHASSSKRLSSSAIAATPLHHKQRSSKIGDSSPSPSHTSSPKRKGAATLPHSRTRSTISSSSPKQTDVAQRAGIVVELTPRFTTNAFSPRHSASGSDKVAADGHHTNGDESAVEPATPTVEIDENDATHSSSVDGSPPDDGAPSLPITTTTAVMAPHRHEIASDTAVLREETLPTPCYSPAFSSPRIEVEVQTEGEEDPSVREDEIWFQNFTRLRSTEHVDIVMHPLGPEDCIEDIAEAYNVPLTDILTANFMPVPERLLELSDDELAAALDGINAAMRGIASKELMIPVPVGLGPTVRAAAAEIGSFSVKALRNERCTATVQTTSQRNESSNHTTAPFDDQAQPTTIQVPTPEEEGDGATLDRWDPPSVDRVVVRDACSIFSEIVTSLHEELSTVREIARGLPEAMAAEQATWMDALSAAVERSVRETGDVEDRTASIHKSVKSPKAEKINQNPTLRAVSSLRLIDRVESIVTSASDLVHVVVAPEISTSSAGVVRSPAGKAATEEKDAPGELPLTTLHDSSPLQISSSSKFSGDSPKPSFTSCNSPVAPKRDTTPPAVLTDLEPSRNISPPRLRRAPLRKSGAPLSAAFEGHFLLDAASCDDDGRRPRRWGALPGQKQLALIETAVSEEHPSSGRTILRWVPAVGEDRKQNKRTHRPSGDEVPSLAISGVAAERVNEAECRMRARGQTLFLTGVSGALLFAELARRLQIVLLAERTFHNLYTAFYRGVEGLARGSILKARARSIKPHDTSTAALRDAVVEGVSLSGAQKNTVRQSAVSALREGAKREVKDIVQERRANARRLHEASRQVRQEELENRAVMAVRFKRRLREHVLRARDMDSRPKKTLKAPVTDAAPVLSSSAEDDVAFSNNQSLTPPPQQSVISEKPRPVSFTPEPTLPPLVKQQLCSLYETEQKLRRVWQEQEGVSIDPRTFPHAAAALRRRQMAHPTPQQQDMHRIITVVSPTRSGAVVRLPHLRRR